MFTTGRLLELLHLFIWKPFDVIGPTSSEGYRSPPWLIFPWLSAGDCGWCHLHPLLCLGTVAEAHMSTGQHPWPPVTGIQTSRSRCDLLLVLWRVDGAGECSLPFPPPHGVFTTWYFASFGQTRLVMVEKSWERGDHTLSISWTILIENLCSVVRLCALQFGIWESWRHV